MTSDLLRILNNETSSFITKVKGNLSSTGTDATGKTSRSLVYEISEGSSRIILEVYGRPFFATVETGRRPTPDKKPSREMISNIKEWVSARGKPESAVWAIAVSIQKRGTALFRKGGRTDIYTDLKEGFADKIFQEVVENMASEYFRKATVAFK